MHTRAIHGFSLLSVHLWCFVLVVYCIGHDCLINMIICTDRRQNTRQANSLDKHDKEREGNWDKTRVCGERVYVTIVTMKAIA